MMSQAGKGTRKGGGRGGQQQGSRAAGGPAGRYNTTIRAILSIVSCSRLLGGTDGLDGLDGIDGLVWWHRMMMRACMSDSPNLFEPERGPDATRSSNGGPSGCISSSFVS